MKSMKRSNGARRSAALFCVLLLVTNVLFAFPASAVDLTGVMTADTYENPEVCPGVVLPYRLYAPMSLSVQAAEKGCGVIVYLHDEDCRGDDNVSQIADADKTALLSAVLNDDTLNQSMLIVAPQCPMDRGWISDDGALLSLVSDLVKYLCTFMKIDTDRICMVGVSDGASGGYALLARQNEKDAVVFSTAFLAAGTCIDPDAVDAYAKTKIFAVTADDDEITPSRSVEQFIAAMDGKGSVVYSRYTGVGHTVWTHAFTDDTLVSPFLSALKPAEAAAEEALPAETESAAFAEENAEENGEIAVPHDAVPDGSAPEQNPETPQTAVPETSAPTLPKIGGTEITAALAASVLLIAACVLAAVLLLTGLIKNNLK